MTDREPDQPPDDAEPLSQADLEELVRRLLSASSPEPGVRYRRTPADAWTTGRAREDRKDRLSEHEQRLEAERVRSELAQAEKEAADRLLMGRVLFFAIVAATAGLLVVGLLVGTQAANATTRA